MRLVSIVFGDTGLDGFDRVKQALSLLPQKLTPQIKAIFLDFTVKLQREMVAQSKGAAVQSRSGQMSRGWLTEVGGTTFKTLFAKVKNSVPYVAIHQFGGVIKGKPWLAIPLDAMKTASGVPRMTCRQAISTLNTFWIREGGKLMLFENRGDHKGNSKKGGYKKGDMNIVPLFVLVRQVKIPKRLHFFEIADRLALDVLAKLKGLFNG